MNTRLNKLLLTVPYSTDQLIEIARLSQLRRWRVVIDFELEGLRGRETYLVQVEKQEAAFCAGAQLAVMCKFLKQPTDTLKMLEVSVEEV